MVAMLASVVVTPLLSWVAQRRAPWWSRPVVRRAVRSRFVVTRVTAQVRVSLVRVAYLGLACGAIIRLTVS